MVEMMGQEIKDLIRKYNHLAEKAGWKPVEKQNRKKARLLQMIKDLEDYLNWFKQKHNRYPTEPFDYGLVRKAYR
jgi:hypothetical protein